MLQVTEFTDALLKQGLQNIVGVPDSTFKEWISYIGATEKVNHTVAVNECEATAIAAGQYLATGKPSVVYMQNDGFGKVVNPYSSLCSDSVFSIPMLFIVGWRGEPGGKDAAQHLMMGKVMTDIFALLGINYDVLTGNIDEDTVKVADAVKYMQNNSKAYALVVRRATFMAESNIPENSTVADDFMLREELIELILDNSPDDAAFVATTGKAGRELFELRRQRDEEIVRKDFYNIGAMGCASSIAFGIASCQKNRPVYVIDGDGALLMQMGALATIGHYGFENFRHIVIDNNAHDSTGGQPNSSCTVDFVEAAKACGYRSAYSVSAKNDVVLHLNELAKSKGPSLLVLRAKCGARADLGRPDIKLPELKKAFMEYLHGVA